MVIITGVHYDIKKSLHDSEGDIKIYSPREIIPLLPFFTPNIFEAFFSKLGSWSYSLLDTAVVLAEDFKIDMILGLLSLFHLDYLLLYFIWCVDYTCMCKYCVRYVNKYKWTFIQRKDDKFIFFKWKPFGHKNV